MTPLAQLLGIEKGNPIGVFVLLTVTLLGLAWWIYSSPRPRAAQALVDLRKEFIAWQARETSRYDALREEKLRLHARCEELEGRLARLGHAPGPAVNADTDTERRQP
jgi:hypothetical protein